ncbi:MAG TPA: Rpn family recombination-promoting nuclease/putative transposase [Candidatus Onthousia faecavium]|nr:Rpn family recombination-promoting nuclease/putative transposase [Candidatus Onthousia faecavium]
MLITEKQHQKILKDLAKKKEILPATSDPIFKAIMSRCPKYRADLVSRITGIPKDVILNTYVEKNSEYVIDNALERKKVSDFVFGIDKAVINIELNIEYYAGLIERNEGYASKIKTDIVIKNQDYKLIPNVIQININRFGHFKSKEEILEFKSRDKSGIVETDKFIKFHLNLKRIENKYEQGSKLNKLEKELLILTLKKVEEINKLSEGDEELMEVARSLKDITYDINTIGLYYEDEERKRVENTKIKYYEELALKKGEKRGLKMGLEQGKLETAKNLIAMNLPLKDIVKATGLSEKQIKKLC